MLTPVPLVIVSDIPELQFYGGRGAIPRSNPRFRCVLSGNRSRFMQWNILAAAMVWAAQGAEIETLRIQGSVWESDVDVAAVFGEAMEAFVFGTTGSGSNFPFLFAWVLSAFCGLFAPRIRGILDVMAVVLLAQATFRRGAAFL